jgi:hypothetical protein
MIAFASTGSTWNKGATFCDVYDGCLENNLYLCGVIAITFRNSTASNKQYEKDNKTFSPADDGSRASVGLCHA